MVFAVPTVDLTGTLTGVLSGTVRLDVSQPVPQSLDLGRELTIVDRRGRVIVGPSGTTPLVPVRDPELLAELRAAHDGSRSGSRSLVGDGDRVLGFATVETAEWIVVAEEPTATAYRAAHAELLTKLLSWTSFALMALVGVWWLGRRVDRATAIREGRARALLDAQAALSTAMTVDDVTAAACDHVQRMLAAVTATLAVDRGHEDLDSYFPVNHPFFGRRRSLPRESPQGRAVTERCRVMAASREELRRDYPLFARELHGTGINAIAATVLHGSDGEVLGALSATFDEPRQLDADEWQLLDDLAEQVGHALTRSLAHDRERAARRLAQRTSHERALLADVTARCSRATSASDVAAVFSVAAVDDLGALGGVLYALDEEQRMLQPMGQVSLSGAETVERWRPVPLREGRGPVAEVAMTGQPSLVRTVDEIADRWPTIGDASSSAGVRSWAAFPLRAGDRVLGVAMFVFGAPRRFDASEVELLEELTDRVAEAFARATLYAEQSRARARADTMKELLTVLEAEHGFGPRVVRLAEFLVPRIGDWAAVLDPSRPEILTTSGSVPSDALQLAAQPGVGERHVTVPLSVGSDRPVPLLLSVGLADRSRRPYVADDHEFIAEIASRASVILESARLVDHDRDTALTLQHALLPSSTVRHPSLAITARYRPGDQRLEVGGDWYETTRLADGRVAFAVGDVVGRGVHAAAVMGRLRSAFAALAPKLPSPAALLSDLDAFASEVEGAEYSTVMCGVLDPATGIVHHASAGHPPMVLVHHDGRAELVDGGRSTPLCAQRGPRAEAELRLSPGSTLLMYSDGLVERRGEHLGIGLDRLLAAASEADRRDLDVMCDAVVVSMTDRRSLDDDLVLLAIRLVGAPQPEFRMRLPATPDRLAVLRHGLRRWMDERGVPVFERDRVLLAVGEASTNAVEHAYEPGGSGELEVVGAMVNGGALQVTVSDTGRWREPVVRSGRGHGTTLMQRTARHFERSSGEHGTTVTLTFEPVLN